jgi:UDP-N-acetylglucosamine 2-epimerase (non-hydrolysing)
VLNEICRELPVVFPVHPRTRSRIADLSLPLFSQDFFLMDPKPYLEFLALQRRATVVITDSGGIQEETTFLNVPCLTVRENTERPATIELGTNQLVGRDVNLLQREVLKIAAGQRKVAQQVPLWDGRAAERIAGLLCEPI